MIYSPFCVDESAGFDIVEDKFGKSLRPRKLGRMVLDNQDLENIEWSCEK